MEESSELLLSSCLDPVVVGLLAGLPILLAEEAVEGTVGAGQKTRDR